MRSRLGARDCPWSLARSSGDVHLFDMRVCGTTGPKARNTPTVTLAHRQGVGGAGGVHAFSFVPNSSLVIAGTTAAGVVLWDTRSPKGPKATLGERHADEYACYAHVLRDGHTLLAASSAGTVQLWDLRAVRKRMACASLGGSSRDGMLFDVRIEPQLSTVRANSRVPRRAQPPTLRQSPASHPSPRVSVLTHVCLCLPPQGTDGGQPLPHDALARRAYAIEPAHERQLAFAAGPRPSAPPRAARDAQRRAWPPPPPPLSPVLTGQASSLPPY